MSPGRCARRLSHLLLAASLALVPLGAASAGPAAAAYPATVASNTSAFQPPCLGLVDAYPAKMMKAAASAFVALGYDARSMTGSAFTRSAYLGRTPNDYGAYVHSHGDHYWYAADARRYAGFREDSGDCSQSVVYSKEILARRGGRMSNLVFMSTCHLGEDATTMPAAFGIPKSKALWGSWNGPSFYVGYIGSAWDSDQWIFEVAFWNAIGPGYGAGEAFDVASARTFGHAFEANWWGSYVYTGRAGPLPSPCAKCI